MPDDAGVTRRDFSTGPDLIAGRPLRNLGALQTAELFFLSAVRLWCGPGQSPCGRALVRGGFQAVNLGAAGHARFAAAMEYIAGGCRRPFQTAASCCAPLLHDEAWLLESLALIQHRRAGEAAELLAVLLPAAAVRAAVEALDGLAAALAGAGLHLRVRSAPAPRAHPVHLWRHVLSRAVH